jgi:hypothetical protein
MRTLHLFGTAWLAALAYACGTSKAGPGDDVTCMPPTAVGGSSDSGSGAGSGSMEGSTISTETCSDGTTYRADVTCPYGECSCSEYVGTAYSAMGTVSYDCDSGTSGAFAACGYPH